MKLNEKRNTVYSIMLATTKIWNDLEEMAIECGFSEKRDIYSNEISKYMEHYLEHGLADRDSIGAAADIILAGIMSNLRTQMMEMIKQTEEFKGIGATFAKDFPLKDEFETAQEYNAAFEKYCQNHPESGISKMMRLLDKLTDSGKEMIKKDIAHLANHGLVNDLRKEVKEAGQEKNEEDLINDFNILKD